ncbi:hypothetical protein NL676_038518 [Syzygium grande]|nr:hypothetical protein NL676_038518 [Syzygium grande]
MTEWSRWGAGRRAMSDHGWTQGRKLSQKRSVAGRKPGRAYRVGTATKLKWAGAISGTRLNGGGGRAEMRHLRSRNGA